MLSTFTENQEMRLTKSDQIYLVGLESDEDI